MYIDIQNYKAIRKASIRAEGMVSIQGDNSRGKTTLLKALKDFMDNSFPEGSVSFKQKEGYVSVEEGDKKAKLYRGKELELWPDDEEKPLVKMFRDPLYKVLPEFPLKRIDYDTGNSKTIFYPNLVFQDTVPLFGQADINLLFSTMFDIVSKLFSRQTEIKKLIKKNKDQIEVNNKLIKEDNDKLEVLKQSEEEIKSYRDMVDRYTTALCLWDEFNVSFQVYSEIEKSLKDVKDLSAFVSERDKIQDSVSSLSFMESCLEKSKEIVSERKRIEFEKGNCFSKEKQTGDFLNAVSVLGNQLSREEVLLSEVISLKVVKSLNKETQEEINKRGNDLHAFLDSYNTVAGEISHLEKIGYDLQSYNLQKQVNEGNFKIISDSIKTVEGHLKEAKSKVCPTCNGQGYLI